MTAQAVAPLAVRRRPPAIDLWIAGKARGKDRPRFQKSTGRTFTTKETENAEANIIAVWREAGEPRMPDVALALDLTIFVERPSGHYTAKGELNATGQRAPRPHRQKPDLDNVAKLVMDALNGRAYTDDVRVVGLRIERAWGNRAGMRLVIREAC